MAQSTIILLTLFLGATAVQHARLGTSRVKVVQPPAKVDLIHVPEEIRALAMSLFGPERSVDVLSGAESQKIALGDRVLTLYGAAHDRDFVRFPTDFGNHIENALNQDFDEGEVLVDRGGDLSWAMANFMRQPQVKILKVEPKPVPYLFQRWNLLANSIPLISEDQFSNPFASGILIVNAGPAAAAARMATVEDDAKARENALTLTIRRGDPRRESSGPVPRVNMQDFTVNFTDDFLKRHGFKKVGYWKADCEGCEHEATPPVTALHARRPHGARRRARERALARELDAEVHTKGCANLGKGKWYADARGDFVNMEQDGCKISFTVKTRSGQHKKRGLIRGTGVFVEPPFPEGKVLSNQTVRFENGAQWERKW